MSLADLRKEYALHGLSEADAGDDPVRLFGEWFAKATAAGVIEPNAMTLATATPDGRPSARVVLLKAFDAAGFTFFTNYHSRKGRELADNPAAALCVFWPDLERQVRVEGVVAKTTPEESDAYFAGRPLGSRIGAVASPQSQVIPDRSAVDAAAEELARRHADGGVPRPDHWGGYRLRPEVIEFWQGRPSRMHDRIRFTRDGAGWRRERLAP